MPLDELLDALKKLPTSALTATVVVEDSEKKFFEHDLLRVRYEGGVVTITADVDAGWDEGDDEDARDHGADV